MDVGWMQGEMQRVFPECPPYIDDVSLSADDIDSFNAKLEVVLEHADEEGLRFKTPKVDLGQQ